MLTETGGMAGCSPPWISVLEIPFRIIGPCLATVPRQSAYALLLLKKQCVKEFYFVWKYFRIKMPG